MNIFTTNFKYRRETKIILAFLGLCVAVTLLVITHSTRRTSAEILDHGIETGDIITISDQKGCLAKAKVIASHQQQIKLGLIEELKCEEN